MNYRRNNKNHQVGNLPLNEKPPADAPQEVFEKKMHVDRFLHQAPTTFTKVLKITETSNDDRFPHQAPTTFTKVLKITETSSELLPDNNEFSNKNNKSVEQRPLLAKIGLLMTRRKQKDPNTFLAKQLQKQKKRLKVAQTHFARNRENDAYLKELGLYGRNDLTLDEIQNAGKFGFKQASDHENAFHRYGVGNENNLKFTSKIAIKENWYQKNFSNRYGYYEIIVRPNVNGTFTHVNDPVNMGTLNRGTNPLTHFKRDLVPYLRYGNASINVRFENILLTGVKEFSNSKTRSHRISIKIIKRILRLFRRTSNRKP